MTTPTTSRVSETMFYVACAAYKEVSGEPVRMASLRAALEAALASLGDVVAVSEVNRVLVGFVKSKRSAGASSHYMQGYSDACNHIIDDLSAILNRGGK